MFNTEKKFTEDGHVHLALEGDLDIASVDQFKAKAILEEPRGVKRVSLDFGGLKDLLTPRGL